MAWAERDVIIDPAVSSPTDDLDRPLIVAIGDSFMSGEGTGAYLRGTATGRNRCHRSATAYPYLVAQTLDARLVFAACSGATTQHVVGGDSDLRGQYPRSPDDVAGGRRQIELLERSPLHDAADDVDIVMISIGGNDAKFGTIVQTCLRTDCQPKWNEWMEELEKFRRESMPSMTLSLNESVRRRECS